jgi:alcohol dehydrogenase class IV
MIGAPHGAICASLLAPVLKMNYSVVRENPTKESQRLLGRISEVSLMLSRNVGARPEDAIEIIEKLARSQNVAGLGKLGLKKEQFPTVVEKASKASSMKGNPFVLSAEKLTQILEEAF